MEIIFEGERHEITFAIERPTVNSYVILDGISLGIRVKDCLGHPNPLYRTIFAIYIEENRNVSAFRFCVVPPLEKVGGVWQ